MVGPRGLPNILPHSTPHQHRLPLGRRRTCIKVMACQSGVLQILFTQTTHSFDGSRSPILYSPRLCLEHNPSPEPIPTVNRGMILSRHDDPPMPSLLPCPTDTPPAYTYPPTSGSDPSESTTNRMVVRHNLRSYVTVIAVILIVAVFATAVFFTLVNHSKV